ncbi:nucleotide-binding oligomerization domain-containing protein 1 isoform X2 [Ambystoma mexicanum]
MHHELSRDSKFITSYSQKEEMLLQETYIDSLMELVSDANENMGTVKCLADLFDGNGVINAEGETVFVFGDAGVGKSILLQKMQNLWARRELFPDAKFFFRFRCRTFSGFKKKETMSLKDLLFKYNCFPDGDQEEVFRYILRFPNTAIFTFDGFDEIHSDFDISRVPEISSPFDSTHPIVLLMHLLSGKLLEKSRKVLTARTGTEVQKNIVRKRVMLRGFTSDNLQKYTKMFFKDEAFQQLVSNHLRANPNLCSLCSVPLFCWIIFKSYEHFHSMYDSYQLPNCAITLTDIFLLIVEVYLNRSVKPCLVKKKARSQAECFQSRKEVLFALSRLAHNGIEKSCFVYGQDEVASLLSDQDLQLGFLRTAEEYSGCGDEATYEFFHLTLQSFFAAFFLVVDEDASNMELLKFFNECSLPEPRHASLNPIPCFRSKQTKKEDPFRNNEHLQFVNLFLCGLLSKPKEGLLRHLVSPITLKKKRTTLRQYLFRGVKLHLKILPRSKLGEFNRVQAMPNFIWMLRCISETQSQKVGKVVARGICADYIKLTFCNAHSADCSALSFVICHLRKRLALELDNNNINDYGVKQLIPCFSKLTVVRLSVNQITDLGVKVLSEELTKYNILTFLGLYNNLITDVGAKYVADIIEGCTKLKYLKIGCNKITSEGGKCLAHAIQKSKSIFDIGMWGNQIGDVGAKAFADAMRNHPSLTNLSLACNGISTDGGESIADALQENTSLRILWLTENKLNDEVAERFAEMLKINRTLKNLWLIRNEITFEGAMAFVEVLKENTVIEEICLHGNLIKPPDPNPLEDEGRIIYY